MRNRRKGATILFFALLLAVGVLLGGHPAHASKAREIVITVSRHGFNGTKDYVLEVSEGETVKIIFRYGDTDLPGDNPHQMMIQGMDGQSGVIDKSHPETTMTFTADKSGEMKLFCFIPCKGMENLTSAIIRIKKKSAPVKEKALKGRIANITVVEGAAKDPHGTHFVIADIKDGNGQALGGAAVEFSLRTQFGILKLGSAKSDENGRAKIALPGRHHGGILTVIVEVLGGEKMQVVRDLGHYHENPLPKGFYSPKPPIQLVLILGTILGGVWLIYGTVAWQVLKMSKNQ